jgi:beta-mannosidase
MQGYPNIRTVEEWDDDKTQLFPQSRSSVNHNKADGFERRLELYLMENFRHAFDMESYIYYTQAMQAECLAAAYRLWRREWRGRGRESTAGALVWQVSSAWLDWMTYADATDQRLLAMCQLGHLRLLPPT